jgi:hypothetical protein
MLDNFLGATATALALAAADALFQRRPAWRLFTSLASLR